MKHFTPEEVRGLDHIFVERLDWAREQAGVPFIITSGYRSAASNARAGGVGNSSHTRGLAVDLGCTESASRFRTVQALIAVGFTRIGIYDRHIHVDADSSLPEEVLWWGKSS